LTERNAFAAHETSTPNRRSPPNSPAAKVLQLVAQRKFDTTASYRHHRVVALTAFPRFQDAFVTSIAQPEGAGYASYIVKG
jgi:hypothetical protein